MRMLIRCDIGGQDGLGHARRMKRLACELVALGSEVVFATDTPGLGAFMGLRYKVCSSTTPLGGSRSLPFSLREKGLIMGALENEAADVLILDKKAYYDEAFLHELRERVKVVRIDHPWAETGTADLVVLPNVHTSTEDLARLTEAFEGSLLVGPEHVLLGLNDTGDLTGGDRCSIAFFAGGSDPNNILQLFYDATQHLDVRSAAPAQLYLLGEMQDHPLALCRIDSHSMVHRFWPGSLAMAGLAVLTFGITVYEGMHLGVPCMTVACTQEDDQSGEQLALRTCATQHLGHKDALMREVLREEIAALWADVAMRRRMGKLGHELIDGHGARRVAREIMERFEK